LKRWILCLLFFRPDTKGFGAFYVIGDKANVVPFGAGHPIPNALASRSSCGERLPLNANAIHWARRCTYARDSKSLASALSIRPLDPSSRTWLASRTAMVLAVGGGDAIISCNPTTCISSSWRVRPPAVPPDAAWLSSSPVPSLSSFPFPG
jgi:hypothetical protein